MDIMPAAFNALIKKRRSVFPDQFIAGKKIPDDVVAQLVENATWAPNHGRMEPWQFTVFTGDGLQKLADFQSELYKQEAGEHFNEAKFTKLKLQPLKASHIIAIGMKRTSKKSIPEIEDIEAVACAVQNIYLSITVYQLGGYWTTGGITYMEKAKPFFGLDEEDKLLGFFYLGYISLPSGSATRKPIHEKVKWVTE
jgi:nitroreductase